MPDTYLDRMLTHAVYFERYKTHEVNQLLKVLDAANVACKAEVLRTNGAATKARYVEIMKQIGKIRDEAVGKIDKQLSLDLKDLVSSEIDFQDKTLKAVIGAKLELTLPAPEKVYTAATFMPFAHSATFESTLTKISNDLYSQWDMSVRAGYLAGDTAQVINRRVLGSVKNLEPGTMQTLRNSLDTNTRTTLSHFAEQTRNAVYRANEDLFSGYRYLATLDGRTCLICAADDGRTFKSLDVAPQLPRHHRDRCLYVPVIKGMENDIGERASVDGPVDGKVDFETWLRTQSEDRQKDFLGPSRYELFKNGASLRGFTSDGRKLSLKDWKELEGNVLPTPKRSHNKVTFQSEKDITAAGRDILNQARADNADVFDILRTKRDFGLSKTHEFKKGSSLFAKDAILEAQKYYPTEWLKQSLAASKGTPLTAKKLRRGYYCNSLEPSIAISGRKDCAVHELAHRMESIIPEIVKAEKEFYDRRTKGEALQSLRYLTKTPYPLSEIARPDKFRDPYMGKYYKGERNYELLSVGIEKIVNRSYIKGDDDDFDSFIIGLLLGV